MARLTMQQQIRRRLDRGARTGRERKAQAFVALVCTPHPPVKHRPARYPAKRCTWSPPASAS